MSDIVLCVEAVEGGNRVLYETEYCGFGKKTSRFLQKQLILSVALDLRFADRHSIEARERAYRERRKGLPSGKSMGCVFLNGDGYAAAKLIDEAGLKGKRIGGAVVSASHANFILNDGDATAKDVRELIAYIKRTVLDRSGVLLMEEIIRL